MVKCVEVNNTTIRAVQFFERKKNITFEWYCKFIKKY
jgi:hypothetical protein